MILLEKVRNMQRTVRIDIDHDQALVDTIRACSRIYDHIVDVGLEHRTYSKMKLHRLTYDDLRRQFPEVPSALLQTVRDVVSETLKATKLEKRMRSREYRSVRLDRRNLRVNVKRLLISISSVAGRKKFTFRSNRMVEKYCDWKPVAGTLSYRGGRLSLNLVVEKKTPPAVANGELLGMDRGINNIVVCSNNQFVNSRQLRSVKGKYRYLRSTLQGVGTRSARRKLKKVSGREKRFVRDVNHRLSKSLASSNYSFFALEDLTGVRKGSRRKGKAFNRKLGGWSFYQLETCLDYKAEALGKTVIRVDPRNTSRRCSGCGHTEKANRNRKNFRCKKCGFQLDADLNASRNIARLGNASLGRLPVNQPNVAPAQGSYKPAISMVGS